MNDVLNDCYVSLFNTVPTQSRIQELSEQIPEDIIFLANQWGWCDTEVRDKIYNWVKDKK